MFLLAGSGLTSGFSNVGLPRIFPSLKRQELNPRLIVIAIVIVIVNNCNCNCKYDDLYSTVSSKLLLGCFTVTPVTSLAIIPTYMYVPPPNCNCEIVVVR